MVTAQYQAILDSLYDLLEGLDTADYAWDDSDAWQRATGSGTATQHLEAWVDLGAQVRWERHQIVSDAAVVVWMRFVPDLLSTSQARIHAATQAAEEALRAWTYLGCRALPTGATFALSDPPEWAMVTIDMTLQIPRG